jgi:crotonobetainyl-CoA:carnitine CoA-transferase CaiB-like acyl-CoA transferase
LGRQLYISNLELDGDSTLFHSINRNKQSFAADLKKEEGRRQVRELLKHADVMVQNFRPGVIEKLGLDYDSVKRLNPRVVYGEVTGYGQKGPWRNKPGQDLLVQSLSGLPWLSGDADQPPVPFGLAVVDLFAGAHLVQGILAALLRRSLRGVGGKVEVSLMESILDAQFEVLTTYLNNGNQLPQRSRVNNAHAFLGAPYGIYATSNGFLALAMGSISRLGQLLDSAELLQYGDKDIFEQREEIKQILVAILRRQTTEHWLAILELADVWCSNVLDWNRLFAHEGFKALEMVQRVSRGDGVELETTRCPIRLDGNILKSDKGAPRLGEDTEQIREEFSLT